MVTYPRIKFPCHVEGKELVAEVLAQETNPGHFNFATKFSDGFEDTFIHEESSGIWRATRNKKTIYLEKIKDDLSALTRYQIDRHYLSFRHQLEGQTVNIWVFETEWEDGSVLYTVYYKGEYQFEMKKVRGAWRSRSVRGNRQPANEELVLTIGNMIDAKIRI